MTGVLLLARGRAGCRPCDGGGACAGWSRGVVARVDRVEYPKAPKVGAGGRWRMPSPPSPASSSGSSRRMPTSRRAMKASPAPSVSTISLDRRAGVRHAPMGRQQAPPGPRVTATSSGRALEALLPRAGRLRRCHSGQRADRDVDQGGVLCDVVPGALREVEREPLARGRGERGQLRLDHRALARVHDPGRARGRQVVGAQLEARHPGVPVTRRPGCRRPPRTSARRWVRRRRERQRCPPPRSEGVQHRRASEVGADRTDVCRCRRHSDLACTATLTALPPGTSPPVRGSGRRRCRRRPAG